MRLTRDKYRPTRYFSSKQEKRVAEQLSGKVTPNSGATPYVKGDVLTEDFTIECKTKTKNSSSITIHKEWLEKLKSESLFNKTKYETLVFNFGPDSQDYAIISLELLKELYED